jgi:hypothetical protein
LKTTLTVLPAVPVPVMVGVLEVVVPLVGEVMTGETGEAVLLEKLTVVAELVVVPIVAVAVTVWLAAVSGVG